MSVNTKIIVLKSKELIYTGIFIILGILLIALLVYMFSGDKSKDDKDAAISQKKEQVQESTETMTTYKPGVYTSELNLGGSLLQVTVTVDESTISHVDITNLDDTVTAMYPLIQPSLDEINNQISMVNNIDDITYSKDNQYTTIIIMEAIKQAVSPAIVE